MNQQKGFSLIEVLISLMLVMSLGLGLLKQLGQTKQLLTHLTVREKASQFLDHVNESLYVGTDKLPAAPDSYRFNYIKTNENIVLHLSWLGGIEALKRKYTTMSSL